MAGPPSSDRQWFSSESMNGVGTRAAPAYSFRSAKGNDMPDLMHAAPAPSDPPDVPSDTSAGRGRSPVDNWRVAIAEAAGSLPFIGKFLKFLIEKKLWGPLVLVALLAWFFVIYPLLVPYLAAQLINGGLLFTARDNYADAVRSAFKVREAADEVTTASYKRLDYFFLIEFSRRARDGKTYDIPVTRMQKVELRISPGKLTSSDPASCGIPASLIGEEVNLMDVLINGQHVAFIQNLGEQRVVNVTREVWAGLKDVGDAPSVQLSFQPVPELRTACDQLQLEVKASVQVFKDLYKDKS